jgi:hypothetical protein
MQALLPFIAELSKLNLRELSLQVQFPAEAAAFQTSFQQLPQTLRQLFVMCTRSDTCEASLNAEMLPPASLPAKLQTTALRQVWLHSQLLHDKLVWAL